MRWFLLLALMMTVIAWPVGAQDEPMSDAQCRALVDGAVSSLLTACYGQAAETACVGNGAVTLTPTGEAVTFESTGDTVALRDVGELVLGETDVAAGQWGLVRALPRVNASGEVMTMVLVGDVSVSNRGYVADDLPTVQTTVTTDLGVNVRVAPNDSATLVTQLYTGDTVWAVSLLDDGLWMRVVLPDGQRGWAVRSGFDAQPLDELRTFSFAETPDYLAMQSLALALTPRDMPCATSPSGVLMQSDTMPAVVRIGDLRVTLGAESTVFASLVGEGYLYLVTLEGELLTEDAYTVPAGSSIVYLLEQEPLLNEYDVTVYNGLARLPLEVLERPVYVAVDFAQLVEPPQADPLAGLGMDDTCTIAAVVAAANLRETPSPTGRVRHVMQIGQRAYPDARGQGVDGALWWRLAEDVWVSSNAVGALGNCGTLPTLSP